MCGPVKDVSSFSNLDTVISRSLSMNLTVDFERKVLEGNVVIDVEAVKEGAREIILDSFEITIHNVTTLEGTPLQHNFCDPEGQDIGLGKALRVEFANPLSKGQRTQINITYTTSPNASALQWLSPAQTSGKKHPYLFTQCESVHARAMVPCQDSPAAKITYTASITVPSALVALMSAESTKNSITGNGMKTYEFSQTVAMPSYLIALVIGDLHYREISPRCRVWSELEIVDKAAYEFIDTDNFLQKAEEVCGPYVWGRYDLLVLPPSFPFGGMENPRLTFITPTLLAGDRSLVNVVAHEIAHSWTGNLVTNATWEHFWLNEGFTVFVERKIISRMYGEKHRHFHAIIGYHNLEESVNRMGHDNPLTQLVLDLKAVHPDDSFSIIPYEKGFNLLFYLETIVGGASVFEPYLKAHIAHFAYKNITTDNWLAYLHEFFASNPTATAALKNVDWKAWLHTPGMPPVVPVFDTSLADVADNLATKWATVQPNELADKFSSNDVADFVSSQKVVLLNKLEAHTPLSHTVLAEMNKLYGFSDSKNDEIRLAWQTLCLKSTYEPIFEETVKFITSQGRMKYVRPLYRSLYQAGPKGKELAVATFKAHKEMYHPIAAKMITTDLLLD